MSIILRAMEAPDCGGVVEFVRALAAIGGGRAAPKLTAEGLARHALGANAIIDVFVAEDAGALCGACLSLMTYSTWRGAKGLYIVDLFVDPARRGRGVGASLLRLAARRSAEKGAAFIKLEVDVENPSAKRFYERLGFARKENDRLFVLEPADFDAWLSAPAT